jgi:ABC-2 type transport system permease protein
VLFAFAIHMDVKHIPLAIADQSMDTASRAYITAMTESGYYDIVSSVSSQADVVREIDNGQARVGMIIPPDFSEKVARGEGKVMILVDGSDPFTTQSAYNTANAIAQQHTVDLVLSNISKSGQNISSQQLTPLIAHLRILYNPDIKDLWFLIPGMIAMLLQTQTIGLTSLSIVREREVGTIEQILVTPIQPIELMIGKTVPNLLITTVNMLTILLVGMVGFGVPFQGNFLLFFILAIIYMFSGLGLGLLISSISDNQRQAQQLNMMLTFVGLVLSGFVFPRYAMPVVLRWLGYGFPLTYFIPIARGIFTKGIGIQFLWGQVATLIMYVIVILFFAVRFFRQRLD